MSNSDQGKQDERTVSNMEDNNAMTVEFLRARLLSERTISKRARQRVDELTERVAELEEQLRAISLQRMKAEKATSDVLVILKSNGINVASEMYESSSEQDTRFESPIGNKPFIEERHSVNSCKGRKDSPHSVEKYKDQSLRIRNCLTSNYSSSKCRAGKSCRHIKRKEPRSFPVEHETNSIKVGTPENGVSPTENCSHVGPDILGGVDEMRKDKVSSQTQLSGCWENEQNSSVNDLGYNAYDRDGERDMEKALEHQAELIGRYEEMERAQREWEEKFKENDNSTPDFCDPGNRSDVTEERYEVKAQTPHLAETILLQNHGAKSEVQDLSNVHANGVLPPSSVDTVLLPEKNSNNIHASEIAFQDFAFPIARDRQNQAILGNNHDTGSVHFQNHSNSLGLHDPPGTPIPFSTSNPGGSFGKVNASEIHENGYALVPHRTPNEVGGILEALREARQSLQQKIGGFPSVDRGFDGKRAELSVPLTIPGIKEDIAVGCAGLFRLPTDSSVEANRRRKFLDLSSRLSLKNRFPNAIVPAAAPNPFLTCPPYLGTRSGISSEDQLLTSKYVAGSRISAGKPQFDSGLNSAPLSFNKYIYPTVPTSPSFPVLTPQTTSLQGLSTTLHTTNAGLVPAVDLLFPDDQIRRKMYR